MAKAVKLFGMRNVLFYIKKSVVESSIADTAHGKFFAFVHLFTLKLGILIEVYINFMLYINHDDQWDYTSNPEWIWKMIKS